MKHEDRFKEAAQAFVQGEIREALISFVEIYQEGYFREDIMEILKEACYDPNVEEIRENYIRNYELLVKYPY